MSRLEDFKSRMQEIKQYKSNTGKGYWDWKAQSLATGGDDKPPIIGTTVTNVYGDKTHYIATSIDKDGTINLSLPDIQVTPRNNLNLAGSISRAMDKSAKLGVDAATYVTPLGDIEDIYNIGKDIYNKNYSSAALGVGLMLLPNFITEAAKPLKRLFKKPKILQSAVLRTVSQQISYSPTTNLQNNNLFSDINDYDDFDEYLRYNPEWNARNAGLFDLTYDEAVEELGQSIARREELNNRYLRLLNDPNATYLDARNFSRDYRDASYTSMHLEFIHNSPEFRLLYNRNRELELSTNYNIPELLHLIHDRDALNVGRLRLLSASLFRDRIVSVPVEEQTSGLYNQFYHEWLHTPFTNSTFMYDPENYVLANNIQDLLLDIRTEIANVGKSYRRRNRTYSTSLPIDLLEQNGLIRENKYDKNNLPEEFIESKGSFRDVNGASYFNMSSRQAVLKGIKDFNDLKHGQAWNLTHNGAVSTDSYPLLLSLMEKYKDDGYIKVFKDDARNVETMILNNLGNISGEKAISRINKKLSKISEITGVKDLKALQVGNNIYVPKISYRKYATGGEVEND